MAQGLEIPAAYQWLVDKLKADATIVTLVGARVYIRQIPQSGSYPCIVVQDMSANDLVGTGAARLMTDALFLVKGVNEGNYLGDPVKAIAKRIDELLHAADASSNADGEVFCCVRERPFSPPLEVTAAGKLYSHLGGVYRLYIDS